jgi:hypothetical protein
MAQKKVVVARLTESEFQRLVRKAREQNLEPGEMVTRVVQRWLKAPRR